MNNKCRLCLPKRLTERPNCLPKMRVNRALGMLLIGALWLGVAGCSALGAKPWDHDLLAERAMQMGAYPIENSMDDHIYFSKEASSGGRSFAGGGCGCN
jgi:hypothetical protein